jgi:hypothetical protein
LEVALPLCEDVLRHHMAQCSCLPDFKSCQIEPFYRAFKETARQRMKKRKIGDDAYFEYEYILA